MKTTVISAYPCCGKTYACEHYKNKFLMIDSDIEQFNSITIDCYGNKDKNPEFPRNYIEYIKDNIGKVDFIFVSSDLQVRAAMEKAGIRYCTVFPQIDMLNEWVGRMYRRGSSDFSIMFLIEHWRRFVENIYREPHGYGIWRLKSNEYLDDLRLSRLKDIEES